MSLLAFPLTTMTEAVSQGAGIAKHGAVPHVAGMVPPLPCFRRQLEDKTPAGARRTTVLRSSSTPRSTHRTERT